MRTRSIVVARRACVGGILARGVALAAASAVAFVPAAARAADPVGSGPAGKSAVVTLEQIPGSAVPRVILSARAAERLGIELGKVGEEEVARKQMVSGLIVAPIEKPSQSPSQPRPVPGGFGGYGAAPAPKPAPGAFGGFVVPPPAKPAAADPTRVTLAPAAPPAAAPGDVWVLVTLSPREWERLAKDKPARLLPLATRAPMKEIRATPTGVEPVEDAKRSMLSLYYLVPGKDHGLALASRMRVELPLAGAEERQKVVPYGAVYYDAKGMAWVYSSPRPLAFERQRISVDRIVGDLAVLADGPAVGTPVVTVGAALLYGAEIFKK